MASRHPSAALRSLGGYEEMGIRRYGFHGLSFEFIANRLTEISPHLVS